MIIPKLVALDTNQWVNLIRDADGPDPQLRREARRFPTLLLEQGYSILFCFHHLQELLAHENPMLVADRLEFIKEIDFISWICSHVDGDSLGTITDIFTAEAWAAFSTGGCAADVRKHVKELVIRSGPGMRIVPDDSQFQVIFSPWAQSRADNARTIAAISPFKFWKPGITVGELKAYKFTDRLEAARKFSRMRQNLSSEIAERGDKRINDPDGMANEFLRNIFSVNQILPSTVAEFVDANFISQGVDKDEIQDHLTVEHLTDLATFRIQLRIVAEQIDIPFDHLKRQISPDQLPHWLISNSLKPFQQNQAERRGSDLVDRYLSCLLPYADVVYIDKRTAEHLRRARNQQPSIAELIGDARRTVDWRQVAFDLQQFTQL